MVRQVSWCEDWGGRRDFIGGACRGEHKPLTDIWWVEGTGMIESSDLGLWWEDMPTVMAPIGSVNIPGTINVGRSFPVSGCCWADIVQAPSITLSLVSVDRLEIELIEIPIEAGTGDFRRQVKIPEKTPNGRYWLYVSGGSFSEFVNVVQVETSLGVSNSTPTPAPISTVQANTLDGPPQGPGAAIGESYPFSLYVHCGVRDAQFDGRIWMADPMVSDKDVNPPSDWTVDDFEGVMKLFRDDLAIFTARSGERLGSYPGRRKSNGGRAPSRWECRIVRDGLTVYKSGT